MHFDAYDSLMTRYNAKVRSGGIAILVKEHLNESVKVLKNEDGHFYWFILVNHSPYDIAFCCVYGRQ